VRTFREEIAERMGHGAVRRLEEEDVPWQLADYLGGGVVWRPILAGDSMRWRRYTIDAAVDRRNATLPPTAIELLDAVEQLIAGTDRAVDFLLRAGDLSITDNRRCLHSRTPITGDRSTSNRLMLRSWIRSASSLEAPLHLARRFVRERHREDARRGLRWDWERGG
jgi:Taurine catabolism dioxygenase TauD, TfdA family